MFKFVKTNRCVRGFVFGYYNWFGYMRKTFGYISRSARFTPPIFISNPSNVFIYTDTSIQRCHISALNAKFIIKKHCAIGEGLTVHTGNHARVIGKFVTDITEQNKPKGYDKDVIIEEDVWIGCNVTLLCGVTIGRGSTVAAGAVVSKSMPPYCVCGGVPAKFIKFYWTIDQILEHEEKLYPEKERYTREQLNEIFKKWQKNKTL